MKYVLGASEGSMMRWLKIQAIIMAAIMAILGYAMMAKGEAPSAAPITRQTLRGTAWRYMVDEGTPGIARRTDYVLRLNRDGSCDGGEAPGYSPLDEPLAPPGTFHPRWRGTWRYVAGDLFVAGRWPGNERGFEEVFRLDADSTSTRLKVSDRAVNGASRQAPVEMRPYAE